MSTPASSGPTNAPSWKTVKFRVFAAGSSAGVTSRGITALRVGWLTASSAVCTANSTSTTQTLPTPLAAITHSASDIAAMPEIDQRNKAEDPGEAHVVRRAGKREDLRGHRDDRELRPDHRDDPGRPQPTVVGRAQRAGVGERAAGYAGEPAQARRRIRVVHVVHANHPAVGPRGDPGVRARACGAPSCGRPGRGRSAAGRASGRPGPARTPPAR